MRVSKMFTIAILGFCLFQGSVYGATLQCINQNQVNLVPLRTISEEFGAQVAFDKGTSTITVGYKGIEIKAKIGSKVATVNGKEVMLQVVPQVISDTTYVPIRFMGEALGGNVEYQAGVLKIALEGVEKKWDVKIINQGSETSKIQGNTFSNRSKTVNGKIVNYVTIDMNDLKVKAKIAIANNKVTNAAPLKSLANGAKASINGTYFAAYNGDIPLPDGTLVLNGKTLHITDIGSTIGFTSDNKVLMDFVKTRVQGYVNGVESWVSYRVNRPTPDPSTTIIYTPEYGQQIPLTEGWSGVVCVNGKVQKIVTKSQTVPSNGFILVTTKPGKFEIGDSVSYKTIFTPTHTEPTEWEKVEYALSAGPSLMINGKKTGNPADESFTEAKILTNVAQRSFIGVTSNNQLMIGTVSSSVAGLKDIVAALGLRSAMCLDGGASSGLIYNGNTITSPGRNLSNSINFFYDNK